MGVKLLIFFFRGYIFMCVFVHCKCLYALCLKNVVLFRAVCFFEKKIVLFPEIFFNLVNDINFLVIEFEGCMNGKL